MSSQSSSLCNLMLQPSDLKKLEDLDPFQIDGFKTLGKVAVPVTIKYCDELQNQISDKQMLGFQILVNHVRNHFKDKQPTSLEHVRIYITSEQDLYLNFVCNFNYSTFEGMKNKTGINLVFNDFPNTLLSLLTNCNNENIRGANQAELKLSYEGTGKLYITQQTEYKKLQLIELSFVASNVQKVQQSIIYRFNYETTRLAMLQKSIKSIYALLEKKNEPLLQYIQKNVGINE